MTEKHLFTDDKHKAVYRKDCTNFTPPNLASEANVLEHINKARGKKTQYISISTQKNAHILRNFTGTLFKSYVELIIAREHNILSKEDILAKIARLVEDGEVKRNSAKKAKARVISAEENLIRLNPSRVGLNEKNTSQNDTLCRAEMAKIFTKTSG